MIQENQLSGIVPDAMASWKRLEEISLHNNRLSGKIPDAMASCKFLQKFLSSDAISCLVRFQMHLHLGRNFRSLMRPGIGCPVPFLLRWNPYRT